MRKKYSHLLEPLKVGGTIFRNRIFTAPMTLHALQAGKPNHPNEEVITHFANKAKGGAACVTVSGVSIVPVEDDSVHTAWDIYHSNSLNYLTQLADRIHFYGAKASMELGGALKFSNFVSFKYDLVHFKDFLIAQVEKSNIKVNLNTEATPEVIELEEADVILAALGAEPIIPSISGIESENVWKATDSYGNEAILGDRIVVIGGGEVGCETALHLAKLGKDVTIVEMQSEFAPEALLTHRTELLLEMGKVEKLHAISSARCIEITNTSVSYLNRDGNEDTILADNIILAAGMKAKQENAEIFRPYAHRFVTIGDCVRAANVEHAIHSAFYAASQI